MKRTLKVEQLENRIAPSVGTVGLWSFIQDLAATDSGVADVVEAVFDDSGNITDMDSAVDMANAGLAEAGSGSAIASVRDSFNVSNLVIQDSTANMILSLFGG